MVAAAAFSEDGPAVDDEAGVSKNRGCGLSDSGCLLTEACRRGDFSGIGGGGKGGGRGGRTSTRSGFDVMGPLPRFEGERIGEGRNSSLGGRGGRLGGLGACLGSSNTGSLDLPLVLSLLFSRFGGMGGGGVDGGGVLGGATGDPPGGGGGGGGPGLPTIAVVVGTDTDADADAAAEAVAFADFAAFLCLDRTLSRPDLFRLLREVLDDFSDAFDMLLFSDALSDLFEVVGDSGAPSPCCSASCFFTSATLSCGGGGGANMSLRCGGVYQMQDMAKAERQNETRRK